MSEIGDDFKALREHNQQQRAAELPRRVAEIMALCNPDLGPVYTVVALTPYQFRVNDRLDFYPVHRRFHDIKTGKRGTYRGVRFLTHNIFQRGK